MVPVFEAISGESGNLRRAASLEEETEQCLPDDKDWSHPTGHWTCKEYRATQSNHNFCIEDGACSPCPSACAAKCGLGCKPFTGAVPELKCLTSRLPEYVWISVEEATTAAKGTDALAALCRKKCSGKQFTGRCFLSNKEALYDAVIDFCRDQPSLPANAAGLGENCSQVPIGTICDLHCNWGHDKSRDFICEEGGSWTSPTCVKTGEDLAAAESSGGSNNLPVLITSVVVATLSVALAWYVYRRCSEKRPKLSSVLPIPEPLDEAERSAHRNEGSPHSKDEKSTAESPATFSFGADGDDVSEISFHEEVPPRASSKDFYGDPSGDFPGNDPEFLKALPANPHADYDPSVWPILKQIDAELSQVNATGDSAAIRKAIRRLYLLWHPDKNPDSVAQATEVFRYIQDKVSPEARQLADNG